MPYDTEEMANPTICDSCSDVFDYDSEGQYTDCSEYRCDNCSPCSCCDCGRCGCFDCREYRGDDRIHDWRYRPYFNPKGDGNVHLGMELEVGQDKFTIADCVERVDASEDHLYLKDDGSIEGAEIVTHPMTLAWARQWTDRHGYPVFDQLLADLKTSGCSTADVPDRYGCSPMQYGLHVHVARDAFKNRHGKRSIHHQMSWLLFISRNAQQLERLARRVSTRWAGFQEPEPGELRRKATSVDRHSARYVAVNCNNEHTYELRFFAGTLEPVELWAALEFADASVEYTRQLKSSDALRNRALTWRAFARWVMNNGTYPNLESQFHTHYSLHPMS